MYYLMSNSGSCSEFLTHVDGHSPVKLVTMTTSTHDTYICISVTLHIYVHMYNYIQFIFIHSVLTCGWLLCCASTPEQLWSLLNKTVNPPHQNCPPARMGCHYMYYTTHHPITSRAWNMIRNWLAINLNIIDFQSLPHWKYTVNVS